MKYLFDTNICIFAVKRKPEGLLRRLQACVPGDVGVSSITVAELRYGAFKSQFVDRNNEALDLFLVPLEVVGFDEKDASVYGLVRTSLESGGTPIGPLDTLIGAQALAHGLTLVTNNVAEFSRIKGLLVEDWTRA